MRVTRVSIALEQRLGDNDYGSERAQVEYSAELGAEDDALDCTQKLLWQARAQISHTLSNSRTLVIRRKANPRPRLCNECKQPLGDDNDGYYHEACETVMLERRKQEDLERRAKYEAERLERQAEYQRERELAGVGVSSDDDDDDDDVDVPL